MAYMFYFKLSAGSLLFFLKFSIKKFYFYLHNFIFLYHFVHTFKNSSIDTYIIIY